MRSGFKGLVAQKFRGIFQERFSHVLADLLMFPTDLSEHSVVIDPTGQPRYEDIAQAVPERLDGAQGPPEIGSNDTSAVGGSWAAISDSGSSSTTGGSSG